VQLVSAVQTLKAVPGVFGGAPYSAALQRAAHMRSVVLVGARTWYGATTLQLLTLVHTPRDVTLVCAGTAY